MVRDAREPRQCRARHGQYLPLRCQEMVTTLTVHTGDHWALDKDGNTVRWNDLAASYPVIDGHYRPLGEPLRGGEKVVTSEIRDLTASPEVSRHQDEMGVPYGRPPTARLNQVGGEHYRKFKIQPWDVIDEYGLSFYAGNALKYLLRAGHKSASPLEDLKKCRHYLDKLIELEADDGRA